MMTASEMNDRGPFYINEWINTCIRVALELKLVFLGHFD